MRTESEADGRTNKGTRRSL